MAIEAVIIILLLIVIFRSREISAVPKEQLTLKTVANVPKNRATAISYEVENDMYGRM